MRVNFQRFCSAVGDYYSRMPQPEVARVWYEDYLRDGSSLDDFVRLLYLDDADSVYQWAEI